MTERSFFHKVGFYFSGKDHNNSLIATSCLKHIKDSDSILDGSRQQFAKLVTNMPVLPHQIAMKASPKPFEYAYQATTSEATQVTAILDSVIKLKREIEPMLDLSNVAVLVGREIAITRGDGPIYNIMPLRRVQSLDHEQFMHHWYDRHATLGESVEGVRYRQNHIDYGKTKELADHVDIIFPEMDGLTESYFDSVEAAVNILSQDSVAIGAIDDERLFIDHARSQFGLYQILQD